MKYFVILLVFVGFFGSVYAAPEPIPEDDFKYSDYVITGKIISSETVPDLREDNSAAIFYDTVIYQVKVEEWHKNQMENNIITVYGTYFPNDVPPEPNWGVVEFEIGDTVYLYIDKTEEGLKFREYASKLLESAYFGPVPKTNEYSEFIDFQYSYQAKMPIQFILENTSYGGCDSFNAKITDKNGNILVGEAKESLCVTAQQPPILVTSQIKIGYDEDNPIIINESGKYYLEVEFDNKFTKRGFIVRQNYSGANIEDINYSDSREFLSPLKQIKSGIATDKIRCNEGLKLIYKYNQTPTCIKSESIPKLAEREWINETDDHSLLALKKVSESCANDSPKERMANSLRYSNGTHVFSNLGCEWKVIGVYVGDIEPEPIPEPEPTYTLTEVNCFTNQVIHNDECVYVLNPTDEFPKDMTKYFLMLDDVITSFCEIKPTTVSDVENNSGITLDRCFEISHYAISDVNEIEFQSTTPPTWINIKLEDLTRNVKLGSSPTFTVVESGWGNGCTSPTLEVYHMKQEIGNDHTDDDLIYEHQIVYSCPWYESIYPPPEVLRIWDESDFPEFPICEEQGKYLIIGDSGYERLALDYYYCGLENEK